VSQNAGLLVVIVGGFGGAVLSVKVRWSMWFLLGVAAANKSLHGTKLIWRVLEVSW